MRKRSLFLVMVLMWVMFILSGCATLQAKYDKATPDEQARIWVSQGQKSLATLSVSGQLAAEKDAKFKVEWKAKVLPSIDAANKVIGDIIAKGKSGEKFTPLQVTVLIMGRIKEIADALNAWGIKVSEVDQILELWRMEVLS